jgi:hypothetical protein
VNKKRKEEGSKKERKKEENFSLLQKLSSLLKSRKLYVSKGSQAVPACRYGECKLELK